jgi:hypothetical protein
MPPVIVNERGSEDFLGGEDAGPYAKTALEISKGITSRAPMYSHFIGFGKMRKGKRVL